ncbi:MAG TPA: AAA family ATPase [Phycisphaerae bacterium]|nr:AAA family ATPase [Phycisphaerales bacterium]HRX86575.1 AAA family ATPase [Phycisphaerae bacterium]
MLTRLRLRNFKRFPDADIELGKSVVFIGPNNRGKTTALQGLALWGVGVRQWMAKRKGAASPEKRPGVTINRRDLVSIPVPAANLLWRDLHVRNVEQQNGKTRTNNIRIEVIVDGVAADQPWSCGLEFDYSNEESFYCRPIREEGFEDVPVHKAKRTPIPAQAPDVSVAYLPPMSGLADREFTKQPGEVAYLIGQGQTAQVLRNLCHSIAYKNVTSAEAHEVSAEWRELVACVADLFGVELSAPNYIAERSEITLSYRERGERRPELDLSSAGRGLQQTLLLLAYLYSNPGSVLLIDEPDAHLEILRQRQIYQTITSIAANSGSQIIAASHSEVLMNEAAGRGTVISFVGSPRRVNDKGSQVTKALSDIGWDHYFQAEEQGWVLYLEGSTDLAVLLAFAHVLSHPAARLLEKPFVHYVSTSLPQRARDHFHGLREAKDDLVGIAIFDRLDRELRPTLELDERQWTKREIENYFCREEVLLRWAEGGREDLFAMAEADQRIAVMRDCIRELSEALDRLGKPGPWSTDIKATDDFLDPLFRNFFSKLGLPLSMRKSEYHELAKLVSADEVDPEIRGALDAIAAVAEKARPVRA